MLRAIASTLVALSLAVPARAQKAPVFRSGLDLVDVTVTVRDARGNLVSDLAAADFVVKEDGRAQAISLFASAAGAPAEGRESGPGGTDDLALTLGMLFDTSASMRNELRLSQESAVRFLDAIPRARDLVLVFFDRDIRISRYNSENQQGIFERILGTKGEGTTALYDAIAFYLSRVSETPGRKVLVLFTDGDDTTSRLRAEEVDRLVRSSAVTIYPVGFQGDQKIGTVEATRARAFLAGLAEASGGQVFQPRASRELAAIYQKILDELGSQYVLGYVPGTTARDGRFRRLTVEVKRPGLRVRHRSGYYAPKDEPPPKQK